MNRNGSLMDGKRPGLKTALNGSAKRTALRREAPQARPNGHAFLDECRCPVCSSVISAETLASILGEQAAHDVEIRRQAEAGFASREAAIRREAGDTAKAALAPKLAEAAQAKDAAEERARVIEANVEAILKERLDAQAEAAAKAQDVAISAVTVKHFAEVQRLLEKNREMERLLEKKTANELGEAGEVDLFDLLLTEFPADQIGRVGKGVNGPDIVHRVFSGGAFTGRSIVYDSKNHKAFQSKWLPKLRRDQTDYGADHAVLVSTAFPPGKSQLMVENGVIVCSPARAAAIAHMLRRAILQTHALGLSNADRDEKTAQLYDLLTSDRATERWERMSAATTDLVEIETADESHQRRTRDKRLSKFRAIAAVHDEFTGDVAAIIRGEPEDLL
jgi:hypothetical protein